MKAAVHQNHTTRATGGERSHTARLEPALSIRAYQKSPSSRANCTPASWPSSQPKTAKLVTSSSNPAQCGHHTLGWVVPYSQYERDILYLLTASWYYIVSCWDSCPYPGLNFDIFFGIRFRGRKCPVFGVLILWCTYVLQRYCCQGNFDLL